jgi:geranylgeranyl diphosphate synthase, type II
MMSADKTSAAPSSSRSGAPTDADAFDLKSYLNQRREWVESALDASIEVVYPEKIYDAMRYSLLAGGKRLRPILCLATCELTGGTIDMAMPTACALEMIHTMSLIHDDLPAMDYGEDIAILAGDGLLAYAFEYLAVHTKGVAPDRLLKVVARLGNAVAATGLVGGQVVDLESEGVTDINIKTLNFIHSHKTGALLEASVVSGAELSSADSDSLERLTQYARNIGLAFQIIDDVLDITATDEELGKTAGKDLTAQKATYPSLWGIDESRRQAQLLVQDAKAAIASFGPKAIPLSAIADYITERKS